MKENEAICGHCKLSLPLTSFCHDSSRKSGYCSCCRQCRAKIKRANHEKFGAIYQKRYREKNKEKARAWWRKQYQIKTGKMKKEGCFLCGFEPAEGHHLLYEYPDKVIWLCRKHHLAVQWRQ